MVPPPRTTSNAACALHPATGWRVSFIQPRQALWLAREVSPSHQAPTPQAAAAAVDVRG